MFSISSIFVSHIVRPECHLNKTWSWNVDAIYDGSKQRNGRIRLRKCFARKRHRVLVKEKECGVWDLNQMMCILCISCILFIHSCVQKICMYASKHRRTPEACKTIIICECKKEKKLSLSYFYYKSGNRVSELSDAYWKIWDRDTRVCSVNESACD